MSVGLYPRSGGTNENTKRATGDTSNQEATEVSDEETKGEQGMNIEETLQGAAEYFIRRILKGEFDVTDVYDTHINILIDKYPFALWTGNGCDRCDIWLEYVSRPNPLSDYLTVGTVENSRKLWHLLQPIITESKRSRLQREAMAIHKKLKELS